MPKTSRSTLELAELKQTNKLLTEVLEKVNLLLQSTATATTTATTTTATATTTATKTTRTKKVRDPNRPKKNKNGYMFFCQDKRESVKKSNPNTDGKELVRLLSQMWNNMDTKQKAPYQQKADTDKVRYATEMKAYKDTLVST